MEIFTNKQKFTRLKIKETLNILWIKMPIMTNAKSNLHMKAHSTYLTLLLQLENILWIHNHKGSRGCFLSMNKAHDCCEPRQPFLTRTALSSSQGSILANRAWVLLCQLFLDAGNMIFLQMQFICIVLP